MGDTQLGGLPAKRKGMGEWGAAEEGLWEGVARGRGRSVSRI